jgi:hypothetical protein
MREVRKRKRLEEDNCNNVPKRTKFNAERQREYKYIKASLLNTCVIPAWRRLRIPPPYPGESLEGDEKRTQCLRV